MPFDCPPTVDDRTVVVIVWKAERRLGAYVDGRLALRDGAPACFPVALGGAPRGDKERRGDERTPEGDLRVTHRNPRSAFHLSLGLDYPTARHAEAAFAAGRIDAAARDRVVRADRADAMPPRDTPLGSDFFIHGGGSEPVGWTDGCIAVDDAVMDWLFVFVRPGARVRVLPDGGATP